MQAHDTQSGRLELAVCEDALRFARLLFDDARGAGVDRPVFELRAMQFAIRQSYENGGTNAGYFDNPEDLAKAAHALDQREACGVFVTLNPVDPALMARASNRLKGHAKATTSDSDIVLRTHLLIDIDPVRPSGISSSDVEHEAAVELARRVRGELADQGWPQLLLADSGNGAHLLGRIDLPNDASSQELLRRCLAALAAHYDSAVATIDVKVFNAARISKVYGTVARKGDDIPDRPHRRARLLDVPDALVVIPTELLHALAAEVGDKEAGPKGSAPARASVPGDGFDVDAFLERHGIQVASRKVDASGADIWVLAVCPFNPEHAHDGGGGGSAFVKRERSGRLGFACHHAGCTGNDWKKLRAKLEPGRSDGGHPRVGGFEWPDPTPLGDELPSVETFQPGLLTDVLRTWISDVAERMQVPPEFVAIPAIVAASSIVGSSVAIRPKQFDSWTVYPNLWGGIIGLPSVLKSPALEEGSAPAMHLEIQAEENNREILRAYDAELESWQAAKKGERGEKPERPPLTRYVIKDATVEALTDVLVDNPNGVLYYRDELTGWLASLELEYQKQGRAFFLEAWDGARPMSGDRIKRGHSFVSSVTLSVLGGIQPGPLRRYVEEACGDGEKADGLLQRLQLLVWPDIHPEFINIDRPPDQEARRHAWNAILGLDDLQPATLGAEKGEDSTRTKEVWYFRFSEGAQDLFNSWRVDLERRLRSETLHPAFAAHLGKYRKLVPALSLLFHLLERARGPVSRGSLERAIAWAKYLESHASRVYACAISREEKSARELGRRIRNGDLPSPFSARDVYRRGWANLGRSELAEAALRVLVDLGWLREERQPSGDHGGRPTVHYHINPKLCAHTTPGTDKPPKLTVPPPAPSSVSFGGVSVGGSDSEPPDETQEQRRRVVSARDDGTELLNPETTGNAEVPSASTEQHSVSEETRAERYRRIARGAAGEVSA